MQAATTGNRYARAMEPNTITTGMRSPVYGASEGEKGKGLAMAETAPLLEQVVGAGSSTDGVCPSFFSLSKIFAAGGWIPFRRSGVLKLPATSGGSLFPHSRDSVILCLIDADFPCPHIASFAGAIGEKNGRYGMVGPDGVYGALPQAIAHRGFKAEYPENTMEAFRAAMAVGAHAIETDLHLSRDKVVMLSHVGVSSLALPLSGRSHGAQSW